MTWAALVPLKAEVARKSRLAARLALNDRIALSHALLGRLTTALHAVPRIGSIALLTDAPPVGWNERWIPDRNRGLNAELEAARSLLETPLVVIHPDLPLVEPGDLEFLLDMAEETGCSIAPDRHGEGTNALAMARPAPLTFQFGAHSFARHCATPGIKLTSVGRLGLSLDCDTPDDLDRAIAGGFVLP
ncbi:2-phospho-L-lactate guanylyltransferase [Sphingomonas sp. CGMCC 1.13654]|uniref:2-phospho-L-lactate guanylyltransferase n=1 Tax=Sphingomonas chungangi TaxID=2683589 RepID=A0A838L3U5_9SPHN|nr:2-phospho-L-lactate guanylyltransferase [Sphingomonas chungangi]MBA2933590.1 2-phospho-L-lactate guanylyltransferase [Sphingomonas chungangi]MVW54923.1 2-phospho-L-lactate guanylyltransferase [Sphingomonas chungangi]